MMQSLRWPFVFIMRYYRNLGLRVALYAVLSLSIAFVSPLIESLLSQEILDWLEFDKVIPVLTILASSMLAVSTFSLNIMVASHRAAADTTTPRVHRLLLEDTTTQSVLAVFIGAFVYSLGSIVLYQAGFYSEGAAVIVMAVTIVVAILIILAMLRWIQHLSNLGSVDNSIHTAALRARQTLMTFARDPAFGATPLTDDKILPDQTTPVHAKTNGHLQVINAAKLQACLPDHAFLYVIRAPGTHVLAGEVVAHISGDATQTVIDQITSSFVFGEQRTFEQDAAFGLVVLSEIAAKALSPGINDPGTAIQAVVQMKSLLWEVSRTENDDTAATAPRVFVPVADYPSLLDAAFLQVSRDGAGKIEVAHALREALFALAQSDDASLEQAARAAADRAMAYSEAGGLTETELAHLRTVDAPPEA